MHKTKYEQHAMSFTKLLQNGTCTSVIRFGLNKDDPESEFNHIKFNMIKTYSGYMVELTFDNTADLKQFYHNLELYGKSSPRKNKILQTYNEIFLLFFESNNIKEDYFTGVNPSFWSLNIQDFNTDKINSIRMFFMEENFLFIDSEFDEKDIEHIDKQLFETVNEVMFRNTTDNSEIIHEKEQEQKNDMIDIPDWMQS